MVPTIRTALYPTVYPRRFAVAVAVAACPLLLAPTKAPTALPPPWTPCAQVRMHKCQAVLSALNIVDSDRTLAYELCGHLVRTVFVAGGFLTGTPTLIYLCHTCLLS